MTAVEKLQNAWADDRYVCVGLDLDLGMLPKVEEGDCWGLGQPGRGMAALEALARLIVAETKHVAAAYKPNLGFYLQYGPDGLALLQQVIEMIRHQAPDSLIIGDCKVGDIDNTNLTYLKFLREVLGVDAATLNGYVGGTALAPFLTQAEMLWFVLCRTSNKGADEFQNQMVQQGDTLVPLYQVVAQQVQLAWNGSHNVGLVAGATAPNEIGVVRATAPDLPILVPGVGAQGGDLEAAVQAGCFTAGVGGCIVNVSRGVITAGRECVAQQGTFRGGVMAYADDLNKQILQALASR